MIRTSLWAAFAVCLWANVWGADLDWPRFRGPLGNGTAPGAHPPLEWSATNHVAWKVSLPGRGRSSPIVLGHRLWLTTALEQGLRRTRIGSDDMQTAEHVTLKALCVEADTGKVLWEVVLFEVDKPDPVHWLNSWATPTPVVEPGRLYCDFGTFGTACLDTDTGAILWQRRLPLDHQVGPGSSPSLFHDRLILVRDGRDAQYLAALNKKTGDQVWRTDRPPLQTGNNDLKKSFSTPVVFESGGRTQLVVPGAHWLVSYDPRTGAEFWRIKHGQGFSIGASPVFGHDLVFFSTGCMKPQLLAVRPDGQGDVSNSHIVWKSLRQIPVMPSPVLVGDELYWVSDEGMVSCAEARTGAVCWQERLGGVHLASPLAAAGRLYFFGQSGKTVVLKPGKEFVKLAENTIVGTVVATPALVGSAIFLRTDTDLYRLEER